MSAVHPPARARAWPAGDETGGIVTGWLLQLLIAMAIVGVLGFEVITMVVTSVNLDDHARDVAIAARDAYRSDHDLRAAEAAAQTAAEVTEVTLLSVEADDTYVSITVQTTADTLFVHRIGALDGLTHPTSDARAPWRG